MHFHVPFAVPMDGFHFVILVPLWLGMHRGFTLPGHCVERPNHFAGCHGMYLYMPSVGDIDKTVTPSSRRPGTALYVRGAENGLRAQ